MEKLNETQVKQINMDSSCSDVTYQNVPFYLGYLQGLFKTL